MAPWVKQDRELAEDVGVGDGEEGLEGAEVAVHL